METSIDLHGIRVRPVAMEERGRWRELMNAHHYLGFKSSGGEQVWYVGESGEEWIGLLGWCTGSFKSRHRDEWIGWGEEVSFSRLKYIANNFRFLILPDWRVKNLASRLLSLNVKRLSIDWEKFYGHEIYAVETFVDERFWGTSYKAANWRALGKTRGYGRHNGKYYYHGQKKTIWVYELDQGLSKLREGAIRFGEEEESMNLNVKKYVLKNKESLFFALQKVVDVRDMRGKQHPLVTILAIAVCAMLSGAKSFRGIAGYAALLCRYDLKRLGSWNKKSPSLTTFRRVLKGISAEQFDQVIYEWLQKISLSEATAIAFDGKTLRRSRAGEKKAVHLLSGLLQHEKITIAQKEVGEKSNEIPVLQEVLKNLEVKGKIITADAMHTQVETARAIVRDHEADYIFVVKDNQEKLNRQLQSLDTEAFPP